MDNFPSNSQHPKAVAKPEAKAEKKVEKVVSGGVIQRKKPLSKRFVETFIAASPAAVGSMVLWDVLIPLARDAAIDAGQEFVAGIFGGGSASGRRRVGSRSTLSSNSPTRVAYDKISTSIARKPERSVSNRARTAHNFDDIVLETRVEAEEVIDQLFELVSKYGLASVADLYGLLGVTANYTDEKYGWTDLRGSKPVKVREGYLLDLPRPEVLE